MAKKERTTNAVEILHRRYIKGKPAREASVQRERINAEIARQIHDLRKDAGLSQTELAALIGTTQSVISRLEDADYEGHSLSMLYRVAAALKQTLSVVMEAEDPGDGVLGYAFALCMQMLRRGRGLTVDELAAGSGINRDEIVTMERNNGYRPSQLVVTRLSEFYGIPERKLMALAGVVQDKETTEQASRFASKSESFVKLTVEEKKALDDFMRFLKTGS